MATRGWSDGLKMKKLANSPAMLAFDPASDMLGVYGTSEVAAVLRRGGSHEERQAPGRLPPIPHLVAHPLSSVGGSS